MMFAIGSIMIKKNDKEQTYRNRNGNMVVKPMNNKNESNYNTK